MQIQRKIKQDKKIKNVTNTSRGITLIALVITIIVLLILAAVSIATLTGENGILTQADKANTKTQEAQAEEEVKLAYNAMQTDGIINNWDINKKAEELQKELRKTDSASTVTGDGTSLKVSYKSSNIKIDNNGNITKIEPAKVGEIVTGGNKEYTKNGTAKIPEGFAIVPGLDDVSQGLVISDVENDTGNTGNQFVWIPVTSESEYVRNTTYVDTNVSANAIDNTDYLPEGITDEKQAVVSAGGFYIGRYEAGKEGTDTLVCKKGATVWTNISQTDAKAKARIFNKNNSHVKSALITGIQWDVAMAFISKEPRMDGYGNPYDVTTAVTSGESNRHIGSSVAVSGNNEADRVCNIYDLEGNAIEYVAEKNTYYPSYPYVIRGGYYNFSYSASNRSNYSGNANSYNTFRPALYVK